MKDITYVRIKKWDSTDSPKWYESSVGVALPCFYKVDGFYETIAGKAMRIEDCEIVSISIEPQKEQEQESEQEIEFFTQTEACAWGGAATTSGYRPKKQQLPQGNIITDEQITEICKHLDPQISSSDLAIIECLRKWFPEASCFKAPTYKIGDRFDSKGEEFRIVFCTGEKVSLINETLNRIETELFVKDPWKLTEKEVKDLFAPSDFTFLPPQP